MAYVNFVNHCYVDTEVEMKEIYTSNHIWTLFENFTLDMARVRPFGCGPGSCARVAEEGPRYRTPPAPLSYPGVQ